jgi:hypothetical protein
MKSESFNLDWFKTKNPLTVKYLTNNISTEDIKNINNEFDIELEKFKIDNPNTYKYLMELESNSLNNVKN